MIFLIVRKLKMYRRANYLLLNFSKQHKLQKTLKGQMFYQLRGLARKRWKLFSKNCRWMKKDAVLHVSTYNVECLERNEWLNLTRFLTMNNRSIKKQNNGVFLAVFWRFWKFQKEFWPVNDYFFLFWFVSFEFRTYRYITVLAIYKNYKNW